MKRIKLIILKPYFLFLCFVCIFLLLSSLKLGAFNANTNKKKQINFPVTTLVQNLAIVDVKVEDGFALLLIRNDSDKAITAISLSSGGVYYRSEFINTDKVILPGAFAHYCGEPSPTSIKKGITILAVVYEDGTSDGDPKFATEIFDVRRGTQAQINRILPLFREALSTPKSMRLMQKRETLASKLQALPEDEEGQSLEFRQGLHDTKELALDKLAQLERADQEKGDEITRQVLASFIKSYEDKNSLILQSLKRAQ